MGAGEYEAGRGMGTMFQTERFVDCIRFGSDLQKFYLRVDFRRGIALPDHAALRVTFVQPVHVTASYSLRQGQGIEGELRAAHAAQPVKLTAAAFAETFELAIPHADLQWLSRDKVAFFVELLTGTVELERHPSTSSLTFVVPDEQFSAENWQV
jgi:hypothetical protein